MELPCQNLDYRWLILSLLIATLSHARGTVLLMREAVLLVTRLLRRRVKRTPRK
jgi:hypothetical protein